MIYLADDYIAKYSDTFSYLLGKSFKEGYSIDYIQKIICYSQAINDFEKSDVTIIAFSSVEEIYTALFPYKKSDYKYNPYDSFAWAGGVYIHLFLKMQMTFEALFYLIPLDKMLNLYHLYHEMSLSQIEEYTVDILRFTTLDIVMKTKKMSNQKLADKTGLSVSTINALRYRKRDINKLEAYKLMLIANALDVKIETLLRSIHLDCI